MTAWQHLARFDLILRKDGCSLENPGQASVRDHFRTSWGQLIHAYTLSLPFTTGDTTKACAIYIGIKISYHLWFKDLLIQCYLHVIIQAFQ